MTNSAINLYLARGGFPDVHLGSRSLVQRLIEDRSLTGTGLQRTGLQGWSLIVLFQFWSWSFEIVSQKGLLRTSQDQSGTGPKGWPKLVLQQPISGPI